MPKGQKYSEVIYYNRIEEIVKMLINGMSSYEIVKTILNSKNPLWNIKERQLRNYIKEAQEKIVRSQLEKIDYYIKRGVARYDTIYYRAFKKGDYKTCLLAQEKLERLLMFSEKGKNEIEPIFDFAQTMEYFKDLQSDMSNEEMSKKYYSNNDD